MSLDSLTALANTGTGTDLLAGRAVDGKFVGAALLTGADGVEIDAGNPLPVSDETVVALLSTLSVLLSEMRNVITLLIPDQAGRMRVNAEIVANIATITNVTTVATVTSMTTLANQTNIGGYSAAPQIIALTQMSEGDLIARM